MSVQVRGRKHNSTNSSRHVKAQQPTNSSAECNYTGLLYPYASLLYPEPTFLMGLGSVFDLGGALLNVTYAGALPDMEAPLVNFNYAATPSQADYLALLSDHCAIASDWKTALPLLKAS